MALITAENLSVGYENRVVAEEMSFVVDEGDYFCVVGENGAGKTTLMRTILGFNPPLSGTISYGDGLKKSQIGYMPQQTDIQRDFPASVYEVVASGTLTGGGFSPFLKRKQRLCIEENMKRLGISDLSKRSYRRLSGGQQQRTLLARALSATDRLLLLDEPVGGLDANATAKLYDMIQMLNDEGLAVMMISHDMTAVEKYAKKVLTIGELTWK